ncbi:guanine deaminase [Pontibacillus chungwhensis BH030062]|uniref:Guanine deaminase n=1 Tax=Pontibacillus chungwhensis BH030062 TaxID=1385513 RepID=A0A0A2UWA4_9BACI|nr:nucleoside deaminase [Pontibacillus chungwhensis]KGP91033.1 guanine deaminase [Pontibacillus chungwhensis BH030062]
MDPITRALELAVQNVSEGGTPFGAVLVKGNEIVAEDVNRTHQRYDVSAHAEMEAIRRAQEKLGQTDLKGCVMYASGEPCPMCLTAMYFAGIEKVFYAQTIVEAEEAGLGLSKHVYMELSKPKEQRSIDMVHVPISNSDFDAMGYYKKENG